MNLFVQKYIDDLVFYKKSANTIKTYLNTLNDFSDYFNMFNNDRKKIYGESRTFFFTESAE